MQRKREDLRKRSVGKGISMVRETIPDETQFTLFNVLFDGIVILIFGDFLFCVGPAGDFDDHVEDLRGGSWRGGQEGNIVPWRNDYAILFKVYTVFKCIWSA
jgi:hypothetical protein